MKKYQYIVAASCVLVGAIGFASMYATSQSQNQQGEQVRNEQEVELEIQQQIAEVQSTEDEDNQVADAELEPNVDGQPNIHDDPLADLDLEAQQQLAEQEILDNETDIELEEEAQVGTIQEEVLHLNPDDGIMWPTEGSVLLDYSTDATIFYPTLQQYQYNDAMVFSAKVNDKVYFVAKGKITNIETNEETGCTVTQDIGDGYTAIYGQLKELNFEVGDTVQCGQVVGYVSEPTKYYSVEGPNVYFQLLKEGVPVDPEEIMP